MSDHKDGNAAPQFGRRLMQNCHKILGGELDIDAFPVDVMTPDGISPLVAMLVSPKMAKMIGMMILKAGFAEPPEHQD